KIYRSSGSKSAGSLKFNPDQQHVVCLLLITTPCFPFPVKDFHDFLHRLVMYLHNRFANPTRSELAAFRTTELVRIAVRAEVNGISLIQLDLVIREVRLILEYASANRELVPFDFFDLTTTGDIQWPVRAGVFHLT